MNTIIPFYPLIGSLGRLLEYFLHNEADALEVRVRNCLCKDAGDDLAITEVVLFPFTSVPDLRFGESVSMSVEQLNGREVALVVCTNPDGPHS